MSGSLTVVGSGLNVILHLTPEARAEIACAEHVLYTVPDAVSELIITTLNPKTESLNPLYDPNKPRIETYRDMVTRIVECVQSGSRVCVVFYGHPGVCALSTHEAVRRVGRLGLPARMLPAISALDCLFADLGVDPGRFGCQVHEATDYLTRQRPVNVWSGLILLQVAAVGDPSFSVAGPHKKYLPVLLEVLASRYGSEHTVVLYEASQVVFGRPRIDIAQIANITRESVSGLTTMYVPPRAPAGIDVDMFRRLELPIPDRLL